VATSPDPARSVLRLQCHWALDNLHDTYPLTRPLSFTIAADVEASEPAPASAADSALSPAQQAAGRHWSAKVGGCPNQHL
jgi:hypothetical protein